MSVNPMIRRYTKDDAFELCKAVNESAAHAHQWLPWCHPGYTLGEAKEWVSAQETFWERGDEYNFLIVDKRSGVILGGTGINRIDKLHKYGMIGYWARAGYLNQGIATAGARETIQFGFAELGLNRIEILMAVENTASKRVAEKTGAVLEGIARKKLLIHHVPTDAYVFSILKL
jgi:RimJ/RimL family protein N-acetyltransferase